MKPPFNVDGTTATQSADFRTDSGMPLSGADSISSRTVPADLIRSSAFVLSLVSSAVRVGAKRARIRKRAATFFIRARFLGIGFGPKASLVILRDLCGMDGQGG